MATFPLHTPDTAPEAAGETLRSVFASLGFLPNLYAHLAEAPAVLDAYLALSRQFDRTSLTAAQRQVVLLAASVENGCEFCVAAHSMLASGPAGVQAGVVDALRRRSTLPDARLDALATFTRLVVRERGGVAGEATDALLDAGFTRQQALEVVLGVAMKTLSNYANHLTGTKTNEEFAGFAWRAADVAPPTQGRGAGAATGGARP